MAVAVGAGMVVVMAAACGGGTPEATSLPSSSPLAGPTGSPAASTPPTSPREAIVATYTAFFPAVNKALLAPAEQARSILRDYATGDYLDFEVRQIMDHQSRHLVPWGKTVVHVTQVELKTVTAKVHDCQDASNAGLAEERTHQLVPQSRGTAHRNLIADMALGSDGRWRVTELKQYKARCSASSPPS